ncbi:hypothetical protein MTBLM1_60108 [Rhodospirillaceae bacterium LM-1]|nr:hypothetical protein MTBLM1_60108 [Rhodospirillaceae bacterium LM-1]
MTRQKIWLRAALVGARWFGRINKPVGEGVADEVGKARREICIAR